MGRQSTLTFNRGGIRIGDDLEESGWEYRGGGALRTQPVRDAYRTRRRGDGINREGEDVEDSEEEEEPGLEPAAGSFGSEGEEEGEEEVGELEDDVEDSEDSVQIIEPSRKSKVVQRGNAVASGSGRGRRVALEMDEMEVERYGSPIDETEFSSPSKPAAVLPKMQVDRKGKGKAKVQRDSESEEVEVVLRSSTAKRSRRKIPVDSEEDKVEEEESEEEVKPIRKKRSSLGANRTLSSSSKKDVPAITIRDTDDDEDDDEELPDPNSTAAMKSYTRRKVVVESPAPKPQTSVKKRRKVIKSSSEESEESEMDAFIQERTRPLGKKDVSHRTPKSKGKRKRVVASPSDEGSSSSDDLEINGRDAVVEDRLRVLSSTDRLQQFRAMREKKTRARDKETEALRSRVLESDSEEESDSQAEGRPARYLGAAEDDDGGGYDAALDEVDRKSGKDLRGFITDGESEEDEDAAELVEGFLSDMRETSQGFIFYVKVYFSPFSSNGNSYLNPQSFLQWLTHVIVCPEVDWLSDKTFKAAYDAVNGRIEGLVNSLIASSAWKVPYKCAIDSYPHLEIEDLDWDERGGPCEACSMGNHRHATLRAVLSGNKYDNKTFQAIEEEQVEESEPSDSEDSQRSKERGPRGPPTVFDLGKNCAGRGQVYHELVHWPYRMYEVLRLETRDFRHNLPRLPDLAGKSKAKKKQARDELIRELSVQAERLSTLLEKDKTISNHATAFIKEIQEAQTGFVGER